MIINKKKPLVNEFQVNIIYLLELVNRLDIYNQITSAQKEVLKGMTETYQEGVNNYIKKILENEEKLKNDRSK